MEVFLLMFTPGLVHSGDDIGDSNLGLNGSDVNILFQVTQKRCASARKYTVSAVTQSALVQEPAKHTTRLMQQSSSRTDVTHPYGGNMA